MKNKEILAFLIELEPYDMTANGTARYGICTVRGKVSYLLFRNWRAWEL